MGLLAAFTKLAAVSVTGVTHSYDLDEVPDSVQTAQLPVLIPIISGGTGAGGYRVGAFSGSGAAGSPEVGYSVEHVLVVEAVAQGRGIRDMLPTMATLIDAYATAMKGDPYLDGSLHYALEYDVETPGVVEVPEGSNQHFYAVSFVHRWRFNL